MQHRRHPVFERDSRALVARWEDRQVRQLGSLEAEVMQRLWDAKKPMAVRDVLGELQQTRDIAYTTVMTVLDNLHHKDLVGRSKRGRAYVYSPVQTREERTADLMGEALTSGGDRGVALLRFVEQMSPSEVAELRQLLGELSDPWDESRSHRNDGPA